MALTDRKLTIPDDFAGYEVSSLDDRPALSASALKQRFDASMEDVMAPAFNTLIDDLASTTDSDSGADKIGMTAISGLSGSTPQTIIEDFVSKALPATGSWTPSLTFETPGTVAYTTQRGSYVKIGKLVLCDFLVHISTISGASGLAYLNGIPAAMHIVGNEVSIPISYYFQLTGKSGYGLIIRPNGASQFLFCDFGLNAFNNLSAANFQAGSIVAGTFMYISAS